MNAWGPYDFSPIFKSAITVVLSATSPCEIQFFFAPSFGVCQVKFLYFGFHSATVLTIKPEFTPANFSVSEKQPNKPFSCHSDNKFI